MKLFDWAIAPNPRRVRIFLHEKGIEIPRQEVGVPNQLAPPSSATRGGTTDQTLSAGRRSPGSVKSPPLLTSDFLEYDPHGLVPVLEFDDGTRIAEAMAICRYFEATHRDPPLMGRNPREMALVEMWERKADLDGMHAVVEYFRNAVPFMAGRALPGFKEPVEQIPQLVDRGRLRVDRFYRKFDERLAANDFVVDDQFTVADITALCVVDFAKFCEIDQLEKFDNIARWYDKVSNRPSARA